MGSFHRMIEIICRDILMKLNTSSRLERQYDFYKGKIRENLNFDEDIGLLLIC